MVIEANGSRRNIYSDLRVIIVVRSRSKCQRQRPDPAVTEFGTMFLREPRLPKNNREKTTDRPCRGDKSMENFLLYKV